MGAFIIAGIVLAVGVLGWFIGIFAYMSHPAPSVQGDASAPGCWFVGCVIAAAFIASTHWLPHIGW